MKAHFVCFCKRNENKKKKKKKKGNYCCVVNCHNRTGLDRGHDYSFFQVLRKSSPEQTQMWVNALRRANQYGTDWAPNENTIICGAHFISKYFSKKPDHPDYCPSLFTWDDIARHDKV